MRKLAVRWWDGPDIQQWRFMVACGDYYAPFAFWPTLGFIGMEDENGRAILDFSYGPRYDGLVR
jgi:hypothetical protein